MRVTEKIMGYHGYMQCDIKEHKNKYIYILNLYVIKLILIR